MAVFPSARRALWRPARLPWLIAAAALLATTVAVPAASLLTDTARSVDPPALLSETSSTVVEAPVAGSQRLALAVEAGSVTTPLLTAAQQNLLAVATAFDVVMAAEEASFEATLLAATDVAEDAVDLAATTETVAEVSQVAVVQVVTGPEAVAGSAAEAKTVAPAPDTRAAVEAPAPAQPLPVAPAPVQPVVSLAASPVERWAAVGIIIETDRQALDDASLANVDAALRTLPDGVLGSLGNPSFGPLHILVNTEGRVLSGDQPYGGPANFFSTNEGTNELVLYPQQSVFTIVHELGHAYNLRRIGAGRYAMVLLDNEMRSFLSATGWQITSSDEQIRGAVDHMHVSYTYSGSFHWPRVSNDDPLEDFANSFAMYFLDPGTLQQSSPERYTWMAEAFR